jgi:hypothetical protein
MVVYIRQIKPKENLFVITKFENLYDAKAYSQQIQEFSTKEILLSYIKSFNMPYKLGKINGQELLAIKISN